MRHVKYFLFLILAFNLMMCPEVYSAKKEKIIKIGAVDLQKVFNKSPGKIIAEEQLDKKRKSFEDEKKRREETIKKLKKDYEGKKLTLNDNEKEKAQLEIKKKTLELKEYVMTSNQKLEEEEDKLLAPLIDDIKDVIRSVSILYGYDIILDKSTYILYIDKEYDITDEVIEQLKGKYK